MKKIFIFILISSICFSGCTDLLDTDNIYEKNSVNFYDSPRDITEALAGTYNALYTSGDELSDELLVVNILGDLMLGGGGPDDLAAKNIDGFKDPNEDTYKTLWLKTYQGIFRCNNIIEAVTTRDYTSFFSTPEEAETYKKATLGEAYFMRGFYLFRAARFFGGMPILTSVSDDPKVGRGTYTETFAQILSDFKMGIDNMPSTSAKDIPTSEYGHANKWIAQGYIARAFLHYTGYMTNIEGEATASIVLTDGTTLGKTEITKYLDDCITNSGYAMISDFRNLWPYSYVNMYTKKNLLPWAWTENDTLRWAGQDGFAGKDDGTTGNSEVMFSQRNSLIGGGDFWGTKYIETTNRAALFLGIRSNSLVPFGEGWGWGTVHSGFFSDWDDTDKRKLGSVLRLGDPDQGTSGYENNKGDHETGFVNKKYINLQIHEGTGKIGLFAKIYGLSNSDFQRWNAQDFIYLRFSDVLLMHSEISETATNMNKVRKRAGLADVGYSLQALKDERMYEFAFEALRWFDLVRWGDVKGTNNYYTKPIQVDNMGTSTTYSIVYPDNIKGLLPIPESEINLSNGVYKQNPGW